MRTATALLLFAALVVPATVAKAGSDADEDRWSVSLTPYVWLPAMTGEAEARGRKARVDVSISDLFTESDFIFALQAQIEAWYDQKFGLILNGQWTVIEMNDNSFGPPDGPPFGPGVFPIEFDLSTNLNIVEFMAGYRLGTWELGSGATPPALTVEPIAGARVMQLKVTLDPSGGSDLDESQTWVEPLFGTRLQLALGEEHEWKLRFRGDIGGFGAGSDFAWNLMGGIGRTWQFDRVELEGFLGARALSHDFSEGGGTSRFAWNVTQYGPILGLGFRF